MTGKAFGELMFTEKLHSVGMTDFGLPVAAIMSGQASVPPLGLRVDGKVQGTVSGPSLEGTLESTDYALVQGDGTIKVHAHGVITTQDNARISVLAEGLGRPQAGSAIFGLVEMQTFQTAFPAYAWVNDKRFWTVGEFNSATGEIVLQVYAMAEEMSTTG